MKNYKIQPTKHNEIINAYISGATKKELALKYKVTVATIRNIINKKY